MNGTVTRERIILHMRNALEKIPFIHACWLEGADANGTVDEYSDLDFWVDFDDEYENDTYETVERLLCELSPMDYKYVMKHGHPKIRQRIYHLSGTSEYLMIDFCFQLHSRDPDECRLIRNSRIEAAEILFDRSGVITYKEYDPNEFRSWNKTTEKVHSFTKLFSNRRLT